MFDLIKQEFFFPSSLEFEQSHLPSHPYIDGRPLQKGRVVISWHCKAVSHSFGLEQIMWQYVLFNSRKCPGVEVRVRVDGQTHRAFRETTVFLPLQTKQHQSHPESMLFLCLNLTKSYHFFPIPCNIIYMPKSKQT